MSGSPLGPWIALGLLGALHGLNPGMGWLLATARGLQREDRRAVYGALVPMAAGHAAAILVATVAAAALGAPLAAGALKWILVAALVALGMRALRGHGHVARGGMQVGWRGLAAWSFLVASAHGAGVMAVPFALEAQRTMAPAPAHAHHAALAAAAGPDTALAATLVHSAAYLFTTAVLAILVYERLGLAWLRRGWINLDLLWGAALLATAATVAFR